MTKDIKPSYFILSLIGPDKFGLLHALTKLCKTTHCLIVDSHTSQMGDTLTSILYLQGTWSAIAKLETQLTVFETKWQCQILRRRMEEPTTKLTQHIPYTIQAITLDRVGILSEVTRFFYQRKIQLQSLSSETYCTHRSSTQMCAISAVALIPPHINIATFRDEFMTHCEEHNLDATLEPQKLA